MLLPLSWSAGRETTGRVTLVRSGWYPWSRVVAKLFVACICGMCYPPFTGGVCVLNPSSWALRIHVAAYWLWRRGARWPARALATLARVLSGVEIDPGVVIGPRCIIAHGVGCVIGHGVVIGADCTLHQCVTLGKRRVPDPGMPTLGDRVWVGANAVLMGGITIGDGAVIGAGAVVLCDVPAGCTAVGNPARVLAPKDHHAANSATRTSWPVVPANVDAPPDAVSGMPFEVVTDVPKLPNPR